MSTITVRRMDVDEALQRLASLAGQIGSMDAPATLDALDAAKAIQSLIKIRKMAADVAKEAIWLEALCLRRLGGIIDDDGIIPPHLRPAANHFAPMSDTELRTFLDAYSSSTALGSYRRFRREESARQEEKRGRAWASGQDDRYDEIESPRFQDRVKQYSDNIRAAATALVSEALIDGGLPLKVSDLAVVLIEDHFPDMQANPAFRRGVAKVLDDAIRSAPSPITEYSADTPRFIACTTPDGDWVRVPIQYATVGQYKEYLAYRRQQIDDLETRFRRLNRIGLEHGTFSRPDHELLFDRGVL